MLLWMGVVFVEVLLTLEPGTFNASTGGYALYSCNTT